VATLLTVPEAARRTKRDPETVRRWIRSGRLKATKIGTQHLIDEDDLARATEAEALLPLPAGWRRTATHTPMLDVLAAIRSSRAGR
jgi:excisionase family DNA binding protein